MANRQASGFDQRQKFHPDLLETSFVPDGAHGQAVCSSVEWSRQLSMQTRGKSLRSPTTSHNQRGCLSGYAEEVSRHQRGFGIWSEPEEPLQGENATS